MLSTEAKYKACSVPTVEEVIERGYVEPLFRIWDRKSKTIIAEFDFGLLKDETPFQFAVQCEQHKLAGMALFFARCWFDWKGMFVFIPIPGGQTVFNVMSAEEGLKFYALAPLFLAVNACTISREEHCGRKIPAVAFVHPLGRPN